MKILYLLLITLYSCTSKETIKERYDACMERAEKTYFTTEDGRTGFSHDVTSDCVLGSLLPNFEIKDLDDQWLKSADLNGQITVFHFWFIKCKPCLEEMPALDSLRQDFKNSPINFIAVSTDSKTEVKDFLESHAFNFRHIVNGEEFIDEQFGTTWGFPSTWVVDRDNKVIKIFGKLSASDLRELVGVLR